MVPQSAAMPSEAIHPRVWDRTQRLLARVVHDRKQQYLNK